MMDSIWWTKVTNAAHFLDSIVGSIQEGQSVVLQLPEYVPWYTTMKEIVSTEVRRYNSTRSLKFISDSGIEPGEYLFNEFCKKEKRTHYRPGIGYPVFLAQSEDIVLNDCILWIAGADKEQVKKWYTFIGKYSEALGKKRQGCLFIIETRSDNSLQEKRRIRKIIYEKEIVHYDNYLFNMLAASTLKESEMFKQYLAEAVSTMLPEDVELSSVCVLKSREFLNDPVRTIEDIVATEYRSDGMNFDIQTSQKVLNERLWEAQIKIVFPLIEKHRNAIVQEYKHTIESLLPINTASGEVFTEGADVEIGTIFYLAVSGKIQLRCKDFDKVAKLKNARNVLAHLGVLPQEEVDEIFAF